MILFVAGAIEVRPSPATHAMLTVLEAGESAFQPLGFMRLDGQHCFMHFWRQNSGDVHGAEAGWKAGEAERVGLGT